MKFGVREICDVVLKRKSADWFGDLWLEEDMPVIYFDTLKTSSLEGAATTVYAQGGKGNPRLVAWEGDRTVTFTMEDALISPESFSILSGAGLLNASENNKIYVHTTEQIAVVGTDGNETVTLSNVPSAGNNAENPVNVYLMLMDSKGRIDTQWPPIKVTAETFIGEDNKAKAVDINSVLEEAYKTYYKAAYKTEDEPANYPKVARGGVVFADYYVEATESVKQIEITADKFGGTFYLEASTLFRDQATGDDLPAEFIIPSCKIQSNFTFTMASTGDPSTFTFTMDAFPDYTRFDKTKKVIAAIQIVEDKNLIK